MLVLFLIFQHIPIIMYLSLFYLVSSIINFTTLNKLLKNLNYFTYQLLAARYLIVIASLSLFFF